MMVAVGLMNSLIRIVGDPYLRYKLSQIICKRRCGLRALPYDELNSECDANTDANESLSEPPSPHLGKQHSKDQTKSPSMANRNNHLRLS